MVCSTKIIQWVLKKKIIPYIIYTSWSSKKLRSFLSLRIILLKCLSESYFVIVLELLMYKPFYLNPLLKLGLVFNWTFTSCLFICFTSGNFYLLCTSGDQLPIFLKSASKCLDFLKDRSTEDLKQGFHIPM